MKYEVIYRPFIWMETMELLYRYVNQITYTGLWNPQRPSSGLPTEQKVAQRLRILQEISDEVCGDVDVNDPLLQKYFACVEPHEPREYVSLAGVLVGPFMEYKNSGFEESAADICAAWETMRQKGGWLRRSGNGLDYSYAPGCPGDLFAQIYAMDVPAEYRLRLYDALRCFPETIEELAGVMRPVAARLEPALKRAQPILSEVGQYWLNSPIPPLEFLRDTSGPAAVAGAGEHMRLMFSLMGADRIFHAMEHGPTRQRETSHMYIGCCISTFSVQRKDDRVLDEISATLRGLSDRKRLEALWRLAKKRAYGLELAELMNMDPGNLSRSLTALHNYGFLRQEKENSRTYYQTDREAMQAFLDRLMEVIFS